MHSKSKLFLIGMMVKYWEGLVRWIAGWPPWVLYPATSVSIALLLVSWGLLPPIDWIPFLDELVTLKLAGLTGHAVLVRHRFLALPAKEQKKLPK